VSSGGVRTYDDLLLEAYERDGDRLVLEVPVAPVPAELVERLFDTGGDPGFVASYPVGPSQLSALSGYAAAVGDMGRYDLFLTRRSDAGRAGG
jgi:hypothetical protein